MRASGVHEPGVARARSVGAAAYKHTAEAAAAGWLTSKASVGTGTVAARTPIALGEGASEPREAEVKASVEMAWVGEEGAWAPPEVEVKASVEVAWVGEV